MTSGEFEFFTSIEPFIFHFIFLVISEQCFCFSSRLGTMVVKKGQASKPYRQIHDALDDTTPGLSEYSVRGGIGSIRFEKKTYRAKKDDRTIEATCALALSVNANVFCEKLELGHAVGLSQMQTSHAWVKVKDDSNKYTLVHTSVSNLKEFLLCTTKNQMHRTSIGPEDVSNARTAFIELL